MILDPDYARVFTQARCIAWQYGYSASLHGSYTRDLDILLTPWTEEARPNHDQLVRLIAQACDLRESVKNKEGDLYWSEKPHGRRGISLHFPGFGDRRWVDISIMPCALKGSAAGNAEYESWQCAPRQVTLAQRCDVAVACLPEAPYRGMLRRLLDDLLSASSSAAGVPPNDELLEGRNSQHVLKAEGESPDATDRENCANASPDGGPMGVGQAAAAAPIAGMKGT